MRITLVCCLTFLALTLSLSLAADAAGPSQSATTAAAAAQNDPKPDLTVAVEATQPNFPNRTYEITVTVKNIGAGLSPKSSCRVFVRHAHAPHETFHVVTKDVRDLGAGEKFVFSFPLTFSLGLFEIEAVADRDKKIAESDEKNNKTRIQVTGN